MSVVQAAFDRLQRYATVHEAALVAFSGGKDSLAVLDMATRVFRRVACFYMYFIPDLACEEENLKIATERYKVPLRQYPRPSIIRNLKLGVFCDNTDAMINLPDITDADVYDQARQEFGIPLVLTGEKLSDAMGRGLHYKEKERKAREAGELPEDKQPVKRKDRDVMHPLAKWNKWHVLAYLKSREIPVPEGDGRNSASIDLTPQCVLWLHDKHPADYERMRRVFPYIPAIVERRRLYNIG